MGNEIWRTVLWILLVPIGLYVGFAALLFFSQSQLVYYPYPNLESTPDRVGLAYEEVYLTTSDGVELHAWFVPAKNSRGVALFCHGNAGNISHRLESILDFVHLELDVFIFDYRGYGRSAGRPTEQGTYRDVTAAWDYLVQERGADPQEIVLFGRSLGGAVASWLAQEQSAAALIVESSFTSVPDMGAHLYPYMPVRLLARFRYSTQKHLPEAQCPVLVIHSPDDELIPFEHGQTLYQVAKEPKEFLQISGGHNEGFVLSRKQYREGLNAFLTQYLGN
jgi:alpha-beta hydrolase superfamily lysophospholipase